MTQEKSSEDTPGGPTEEEPVPYPGVAPVVCSLKQTSWPCRLCLELTCNSWWKYMSAVMVLLNCTSMIWYDPCKGRGSVLEVLDIVFFVFFLAEMLIKVAALGLFGNDGSYLSDSWNRLDLFIVFVDLLGFILNYNGIDVSWLQDFLRPQRVISRLSSMLLFVTMLLDTLPMLGNILLLSNFLILIFSIAGVQMWTGKLRNRCFLGEDVTQYNLSLPPFYSPSEQLPFICSHDNKHGMLRCRDIPPWVQNGTTCLLPPHYKASLPGQLMPSLGPDDCYDLNNFYNVCRHSDQNPYMGNINFDNIGYAWISLFQIVTLEGWSEIMYFVMDTHSFWSFIFFVFVTIIGSFVLMNICAVIIVTQFSEGMEEKAKGRSSHSPVKKTIICWLQMIFEQLGRFLTALPWYNKISQNHFLSLLVGKVWSPVKQNVKRLAVMTFFQRIITSCVILSVVAVSVEHHKQPPELSQFIRICHIIFTLVFIVEMVLKLIAYVGDYFRDKHNILDFVTVIVGIWELTTCSAFSVLLRFVRLVLSVPYLKKPLQLLKKTIQETTTLCGLILLLIFTFSVLGMHLFGCRSFFKNDRKNFDSLLWAMVTVFQLLTQEEWNIVMYNGMAATSQWASLYFVAIIVLGRHLLLNVLVSIVVYGFKTKEGTDNSNPTFNNNDPSNLNTSFTDMANSEANPAEANTTENCHIWSQNLLRLHPGGRLVLANSKDNMARDNHGSSSVDSRSTAAVPDSEEDTTVKSSRCNFIWMEKCIPSWCKEREDWSLFLFSPNNKFRTFCRRLTSHVVFKGLILFFVALTCVTIAAESHNIKPESTERYILDWSGYVFAGIFLLEMILKIIELGFLFGKGSYCQSLWNLMDGVLVILFIMHTVVELANSEENNLEEILKPLRLLRTLCPLRLLKRTPRLKRAVEDVIASFKSISDVFVVSCVFFTFYGILGVQLFKGQFYNCVDKTMIDIKNVTNKTDCLASNYRWVRRSFNFDSLPQALMTLFVMYSQDGWANIMYDGLDAVAEDIEPVTNYSQWRLVYFISFMMVSFLLLDMFISILVEKYTDVQKREHTKHLLSKSNEILQEDAEEVPYYSDYSPLRRSIHTLCRSRKLDFFKMVILVLNVMVMSVKHYNQPQYVEELIEGFFFLFTCILACEVGLKMVAFGAKRFFQNSWNWLDIILVLISVVSIVLYELKMTDTIPVDPSILRVCRVLRLAQVLKAKRIRVLVKTIFKTLLQVGNLCLLFSFFFFIYSVLGVELFEDLECSKEFPCQGLHRHANFNNFGIALLTLYKVCTGDNWSGILKDTLRECHPDDKNCKVYLFWAAPLVLITFVIMVHFLLANLVVSSIIQALDDGYKRKDTNTDTISSESSVSEGKQPSPTPPSSFMHSCV